MTWIVFCRVHRWLACAFACFITLTMAHSRAEEHKGSQQFRFVAQKAGNSFDHYICLGLAGGIECLEEGTEIEGVESSEKLASRLWKELTHPVDDAFAYCRNLRLRDGTEVPTCSKAAIEEIGNLIQEKFEHTVKTRLWKVGVEPDPNSPEGRVLLETRQKYVDLQYRNAVSSDLALKALFKNDNDGLIALSGWGTRYFVNGPPQRLVDKYHLKIDPKTGKYPAVRSNHAFLVQHNEDDDAFYVYDSDDPDRRWLLVIDGTGDRFVISWQIHDHMGNGPSHQFYYHVKPLDEYLGEIRDIVDANCNANGGSKSTSAKSIEP